MTKTNEDRHIVTYNRKAVQISSQKKERIIKNASDLLPKILSNIEKKYKNNPLNVVESWPIIIGSKLAPMTQVVGFDNGVLTVKVKSSTLYSLLNNYEKDKLLEKLQKNFSEKIIQKLCFKLG